MQCLFLFSIIARCPALSKSFSPYGLPLNPYAKENRSRAEQMYLLCLRILLKYIQRHCKLQATGGCPPRFPSATGYPESTMRGGGAMGEYTLILFIVLLTIVTIKK